MRKSCDKVVECRAKQATLRTKGRNSGLPGAVYDVRLKFNILLVE